MAVDVVSTHPILCKVAVDVVSTHPILCKVAVDREFGRKHYQMNDTYVNGKLAGSVDNWYNPVLLKSKYYFLRCVRTVEEFYLL